MKVTVDSKKGLKTNLKVFVDKKTIDERIVLRLNELSKTINMKGFRPGKVPVDVIKKQFGKAVYGEVLEKLLKETSTKAIEEKKIKVAGQPKLDLKSYAINDYIRNIALFGTEPDLNDRTPSVHSSYKKSRSTNSECLSDSDTDSM